MDDFLTSLTGAAGGGVLGLIAPFLNAGLGMLKGHFEHKRQIELVRLQTDAKTAEAAGAIALAREQGANAAFTSAIQAEGAITGESQWVRDVRGAIRPVLTGTGLLITSGTGIAGIVNPLTIGIATITGTMVGFWFGQRALDKSMLVWAGGKFTGSVTSKTTK